MNELLIDNGRAVRNIIFVYEYDRAKELDRIAAEMGLSRSAIIRAALNKYIEEYKEKKKQGANNGI